MNECPTVHRWRCCSRKKPPYAKAQHWSNKSIDFFPPKCQDIWKTIFKFTQWFWRCSKTALIQRKNLNLKVRPFLFWFVSNSYWLIHSESEWAPLIGCWAYHMKTLNIWRYSDWLIHFESEWPLLIGCWALLLKNTQHLLKKIRFNFLSERTRRILLKIRYF